MDLFDEQILTVLRDGKPRVLAQLLDTVDFSRNTLKVNLKRLVSQDLVVKEKVPSNGKGRPKYVNSVPLRLRQQISTALSDPTIALLSLQFSRLRHLCRFEKGGYCKQTEKTAYQKTALKFQKPRNKNHF